LRTDATVVACRELWLPTIGIRALLDARAIQGRIRSARGEFRAGSAPEVPT
jgi:hypothetical protein